MKDGLYAIYRQDDVFFERFILDGEVCSHLKRYPFYIMPEARLVLLFELDDES